MASACARSGLLACPDQAPLRLHKISTKRRIAISSLPECVRDVILRAGPSHMLRWTSTAAALAHVEVDRPAHYRADRCGDVVEDHGRDGGVDGERDERVPAAGVPGHLHPRDVD